MRRPPTADRRRTGRLAGASDGRWLPTAWQRLCGSNRQSPNPLPAKLVPGGLDPLGVPASPIMPANARPSRPLTPRVTRRPPKRRKPTARSSRVHVPKPSTSSTPSASSKPRTSSKPSISSKRTSSKSKPSTSESSKRSSTPSQPIPKRKAQSSPSPNPSPTPQTPQIWCPIVPALAPPQLPP